MDKSVLFVCEKNLTRSTDAHFKFQHYLEQQSTSGITVDSAGLKGDPSKPLNDIEKAGLRVLGELVKRDLSQFQPKRLDDNLVRNTSIIIGMSEQITNEIRYQYPHAEAKTHVVTKFGKDTFDKGLYENLLNFVRELSELNIGTDRSQTLSLIASGNISESNTSLSESLHQLPAQEKQLG